MGVANKARHVILDYVYMIRFNAEVLGCGPFGATNASERSSFPSFFIKRKEEKNASKRL